MSNTSYTEDEIIHVLNKHREEKYKSTGRSSQETSEQDDVASLRQQIGTLRKYSQQAQEEAVKYKQGLTETLEKLSDSESDRQRLLRENEDLATRLRHLDNPHDAVNQLQEALELNHRQKQRIERMSGLIQEKDIKINELQQFEYSFKKAGEWKIKQQAELELEKDKAAKWEHDYHAKCQELEAAQHHMGQLERVSQILKDQLEGYTHEVKRSHDEVAQLRQGSVQVVEKYKEAQKHLEDMEQLLTVAQAEKKELQDELSAITGQFDSLRIRVQDSHQKLETQRRTLLECEAEKQKLIEEKEHLSHQLSDKIKHMETYDQDLELIKQTLMRAMREAKDIEIRYQEAVNEKVSAVNKSNQLQHLIERQREDIGKLKEELQQITIRLEQALRAKDDKEQQLLRAQESLYQRGQEIESLNRVESDLRIAQESIEDREQRLKLAQQHLAKKVKETTQLSEALEEQKLQNQDLMAQLTHAKDKIHEVQSNTETMIQQEKKLQEQLADSLKVAESQISKWESKYFSLQEKWQELDVRHRELRGLEEKYNQMQTFLAGLGNFIQHPAAVIAPAAPPVPVPTLEIPQEPKPKSVEKLTETKTLFDGVAAGGVRAKKSLFD